MKSYIVLMRPRHYIKNGLLLLPIVFSGRLLEAALLWRAAAGFLSFCFLSSFIYILNDIRDAAHDRLHPTKCNRPIASRAVSVRSAWILAAVVLILSCAFNIFAAGGNISGWVFWLLYLIINIAYSMWLKHVAIVDVALLASGFLLRVLYGASITEIEISRWLYLTVISAAFYLGLGKRRNELSGSGEQSRKVLARYNLSFLDKNMYLCMALAIVFYSLWSVDAITIARVGSTNLIWTVPLVLLICLKYSLIVENSSDGDPVEVLFSDWVLCLLVVVFAAVMLGIVYL